MDVSFHDRPRYYSCAEPACLTVHEIPVLSPFNVQLGLLCPVCGCGVNDSITPSVLDD